MKSIRYKYKAEYPFWPRNELDALGELTELNDLLSQGGLTRQERNWAYDRRHKLVKFLNDADYRAKVHAGGGHE